MADSNDSYVDNDNGFSVAGSDADTTTSDTDTSFSSELASATSAAGGRYFTGTNGDKYFVDSQATVSEDKGTLSGDRTDAVLKYETAAKNAGLSEDQISENVQNIETETNHEAKSSDLSQNTYTMDDATAWLHNSNNKDVTGYGKMSQSDHENVANNDLQHLKDVLLSDKNAFKYDEAQRGLSENQILNDLHSQQLSDDHNLSLGSANADKLNKKWGLDGSTTTSNSGTKRTYSGSSNETAASTGFGKLNANATTRKTKDGTNVPLYAKSISASQTVGKDGKPEFKFFLDAKSRADLDKSAFGGRYLNNSGSNNNHSQEIDKTTFNQILKANGKKPLTNKQISAAIKSGRPLVNAADNIAFNANVSKGADNKHYNIDGNSISKPSAKFDNKNESKLEHGKAARSNRLNKAAAKSTQRSTKKVSVRATHHANATKHSVGRQR